MFHRLAVGFTTIASATLWGMAGPTTAPATTQPCTPQEFVQNLVGARPGDVIQTPFTSTATIPMIPLRIEPVANAPQFLLSDQPEYFRTGDGTSMQEDIKPGVVRLYIYHVPESTGERKVISAVIENLGTGPMAMEFKNYASLKPSGNYHSLARDTMKAFLSRTPPPDAIRARLVPPKRRMVIDPAIDSAPVTKDILVHTFYEFEVDQPARVTVFQKSPQSESTTVIDALPKLPRVLQGFHASGAGRGLFLHSEMRVTTTNGEPIDTSDGPRLLLVADGKSDPWIEGRDSIDQTSPSVNKGNYGVMYRVQLRYRSTDGKRLAVLMSGHRPDNKWCRYTAAAVEVNSGISRGGVFGLPTSGAHFDSLPQAVVMQTYPAAEAGQSREIELTYSPPGACCLPTPIWIVPF